MLINLHVKNLAIIDEIEVDFTDRLNILTGETGAGKSIIIGSINIALGGKVPKDIIRKGSEYALIELVFQLEDDRIINILKEKDLNTEDGQIIISRKIMTGRTINKVNGENVTALYLKEIAEYLIDIHGQHEHQSLLYKKNYLDIIDRFSKNDIGNLKNDINKNYYEYRKLVKELEEEDIDEEKRQREISFLQYEISEIESAYLEKDEEENLKFKYKKLSNANKLLEGLGEVYSMTSYESENSAGNYVGKSVKIMSHLLSYDKEMEVYFDQITDIENLLNDFNRGISDYMSSLDFKQEDYISIEKRMDIINGLKSKYGNSYEEIQNYYNKSIKKLEKLDNYNVYLNDLKEKIKTCENKLEKLSEKLSKVRKKKSKELAFKMKEALVDLNFLDVKFEINFSKMDKYTENGFDDCEFLISTNPGEDLKPLSNIASGGELSRIMLALKSILASEDVINTLIFDEIDVGVSGRTAQKVSEKLALISKNHQVICITHLPQIAAMADTHFIIEKLSDGNNTATNIKKLSQEESVAEIARILGGAEITENVIVSAREMKELAAKTK